MLCCCIRIRTCRQRMPASQAIIWPLQEAVAWQSLSKAFIRCNAQSSSLHHRIPNIKRFVIFPDGINIWFEQKGRLADFSQDHHMQHYLQSAWNGIHPSGGAFTNVWLPWQLVIVYPSSHFYCTIHQLYKQHIVLRYWSSRAFSNTSREF